jgi:hypothetical protein
MPDLRVIRGQGRDVAAEAAVAAGVPPSLIELELLAEEMSRKAGRNWRAPWRDEVSTPKLSVIRGGRDVEA